MKTSESINELAAALARAQGTMSGAKKDSDNPFFHSKYADLASNWDACRGPLSTNGLSVAQFPTTSFSGEPEPYEWTTKSGEKRYGVRVACTVSVVTRLMHSSGQWIEDESSALLPTGDPQAVGSAITYLRRYSLSAVTGTAPEDDDGNAAYSSGQPRRAAAAKAAATDGKEPTSSEERTQAFENLNSAFALLYRESPGTMPFGPSDRSEKAQKARLDLVSQIMGTEIKDIRGLTTDALKRCAAELPKAFANGGK